MTTILSAATAGQQAGKGLVVVNDKPIDPTKDPVNIRAAIFFDGTFNNRANVALARANPGATRVAHGTEQVTITTEYSTEQVTRPKMVKLTGTSYTNYFSNVAIMDWMNDIRDADTQLSVYVEGVGTLDYEGDDFVRGGGLGVGPTGLTAKVTRGIVLLSTELTNLLRANNRRLGQLKVDVYGFSRGAASARHFVARRTAEFFPKETNLAGTLGVPADSVSINFVGLYDTVSSYAGLGGTNLFSRFSDDVPQLRLNIGSTAKRVVQLAAGDEYRKNFASTTIQSSVQAGVGYECTIPGAHSDVGGGYNDGQVDTVTNILKAERDELVAAGWFTAQELPEPGPPIPVYYPEMGQMVNVPATTRGTRTVKGGYQFVPLSLMMDLAKKEGATFKPFSNEFAKYRVPGPLAPLYSQMQASVVGQQELRFPLTPDLLWVRNQYLHRSANDSFPASVANGSRKVDGRMERQYFAG